MLPDQPKEQITQKGTVNLTVLCCNDLGITITYPRHRFPAEIISYCVWLYYTFPLSFRDIEKMMLYRGIHVTYEAIRK